MKKVLAFIAALTLAVFVTACGDKIRQENQSSDTEPGAQLTNSSDSTGTENPEKSLKELIDSFEMDDFPAPDGEILKKADAVGVEGDGERVFAVTYDFAYMRKVQPIFINTLDDPDAFDWDNMEFKSVPEIPEDLGWFKIKAGDMLDNGLKVKSASISLGRGMDGMVYNTIAELEGELALEGIMYRYSKDDVYITPGDVIFYPDAVKHPNHVVLYDYSLEPWQNCDPKSNFALMYSGKSIELGNESELPDSIIDLFGSENAVKVRITFTNPTYRMTPMGIMMFAETKTAEPLE